LQKEEMKSACGDDEVKNLAGAAAVQISTLLGERRQTGCQPVAHYQSQLSSIRIQLQQAGSHSLVQQAVGAHEET